jgi:hypothetical protein
MGWSCDAAGEEPAEVDVVSAAAVVDVVFFVAARSDFADEFPHPLSATSAHAIEIVSLN